MTYKIISTRQFNETLITSVEFNFDGKLHIVDIPHFMPNSQEDIEQTIINASQSELAKLQAIENIESIVSNLVINEIKTIE
jgi:hypothetical protein